MNIFVGNLARTVTEDRLRTLFATYGNVVSVKVIKDKFTGNVRGFAFVEMGSHEEAVQAIEGLNGKELEGQRLRVNEARPREEGAGNGDGRPSSRPPMRRFNNRY